MNTNKSDLSPQKILEIVYSFQKCRILLTAYELEIFTILDKKSKSSNEVAKILRTNKRAIDRLLNALCAINLVLKNGEKFSNSEIAATFLVKDNPQYLSGISHTVNLWDSWSTLTKVISSGKTQIKPNIKKRGKDWLKSFISAMHWRAKRQVSEIIGLIDLSNVYKVLDVGGGSGAYSTAFVKAKKEIKATVFDLPNVVPLTKYYLKKEKLTDKIKISAGDYNTDKFKGKYDLIFLSAIIHSNSYKANKKLIKKCAKSLNKNGHLVILDFVMEESRTQPAIGALFAINMLVATKNGDTYTEKEIKSWLQKTNLNNISRINTNFGTSLIIGKK